MRATATVKAITILSLVSAIGRLNSSLVGSIVYGSLPDSNGSVTWDAQTVGANIWVSKESENSYKLHVDVQGANWGDKALYIETFNHGLPYNLTIDGPLRNYTCLYLSNDVTISQGSVQVQQAPNAGAMINGSPAINVASVQMVSSDDNTDGSFSVAGKKITLKSGTWQALSSLSEGTVVIDGKAKYASNEVDGKADILCTQNSGDNIVLHSGTVRVCAWATNSKNCSVTLPDGTVITKSSGNNTNFTVAADGTISAFGTAANFTVKKGEKTYQYAVDNANSRINVTVDDVTTGFPYESDLDAVSLSLSNIGNDAYGLNNVYMISQVSGTELMLSPKDVTVLYQNSDGTKNYATLEKTGSGYSVVAKDGAGTITEVDFTSLSGAVTVDATKFSDSATTYVTKKLSFTKANGTTQFTVLATGEVSLASNASITVGDSSITNSGNTAIVVGEGGSVTLEADASVTLGENEYTNAGSTSILVSADGSVTLDSGESVIIGNSTFANKGNKSITVSKNGLVTLAQGASVEIAGGILTNTGNKAIVVDADGNVKGADGGDLSGGESFTTSDGTYTVQYALSADAKEIKVVQTKAGERKKTVIYKAKPSEKISVTLKDSLGAFADDDFTVLNELSGVSTSDYTEIKLPPIKEISTLATYDAFGQETTTQSEIAITVNGTTTPKTVTVSRAMDATTIIDLTDAEANVTDNTGTAIFEMDNSTLSGRTFSVKSNVVTETGTLLTVTAGNVKTSDRDGKFSLASGCSITTTENSTLTINGAKVTLAGNGNGVTYTADTTKPNRISAITGLDSGEAVTLESSFTGGKLTVDDTDFTAITSKNGITFRKQGSSIEVELDQKGETVTVGGFTYTLENVSNGGVTIYTDAKGSHVAGLNNGDKVTVTKGGLTTTYEVSDGKLVIGYTDSNSKATTKSYTLGGESSFTATWDGTTANAPTSTGEAGTSLKSGSVTIGETDLNSVVDGTQIDSQGNVTTDENKAVAAIETTDDSLTYKAKSNSGKQELNISDTNGVDWNIDTQASKGKTHVEAGTSAKPVNNSVNVETGSGKSEVAVYSNSDSKIQGGSGNLDATVGGKGDHNVTAGSGSKNELKDFGTGENVLTGGSGKNTFESSNENGKLVAGTGKNTFKTTKNVTNKVEGFTYGRDEASIDSAISDLSKFIVGEGNINYDGKAANGELDVSSGTGTGNIFAVTILDSTGKKTNVGWTGENGGNIDATSETRSLVLIGDQNGDAKDILMGGKGRDVIYAGEGDSVTGGEGRNELHLNGSGIAVGFGRTGAKDEVTGFKSGFDNDEADSILLMDAYAAEELNLALDGKDAVLKSNGTSMTLDSIQKNTATNAVELLIGGAKVAAIEKDTTAKITEADYADVYFGTGSAGIDFEAVSDDLTIDLSDKSRFRNISSVTGGTGNTLLMGGGSKVTLVSGGGNTSLWGGTGNAMLVGDKDSRDEFFFFGESGRDTVSGFAAGTDDTSDVLNLYGSAITDIRGTAKGVEISTTENSKVIIQGLTANDKLQWVGGDSKGVAKIGSKNEANSFTYEADVTNYFGGNKIDTLKISGESSTVWLDRVGSSIEIIDASGSTGNNIIAGSSESQTIKGGRGNNSLWGGAGGNDILTGGGSYNEFYFGIGEGNDIITSSNDGDKIMLYNVKVSDLDAAGMKDGNMVIALKDGSSMTIQNYDRQGATTFQLSDGTYSYDRNTGNWNEKNRIS